MLKLLLITLMIRSLLSKSSHLKVGWFSDSHIAVHSYQAVVPSFQINAPGLTLLNIGLVRGGIVVLSALIKS